MSVVKANRPSALCTILIGTLPTFCEASAKCSSIDLPVTSGGGDSAEATGFSRSGACVAHPARQTNIDKTPHRPIRILNELITAPPVSERESPPRRDTTVGGDDEQE